MEASWPPKPKLCWSFTGKVYNAIIAYQKWGRCIKLSSWVRKQKHRRDLLELVCSRTQISCLFSVTLPVHHVPVPLRHTSCFGTYLSTCVPLERLPISPLSQAFQSLPIFTYFSSLLNQSLCRLRLLTCWTHL